MRDPLAWSEASKCLFVAALLLMFSLWYWADWQYVQAHPESAPYIDIGFLPTALRALTVTMAAWLLVAVVSLAARRSRRSPRALAWVTVILVVWQVGFASYCFGISTSPFFPIALITSFAVGLVLFEKRVMLVPYSALGVVVLGLVIAEQQGLVPYAPLFREAPYQAGELHPSWLTNTGRVTTLMLLACLALLYFVIERWHDREAALAAAKDQLARANGIIRRYVPGQLGDRILAGSYPANVPPERRKLTHFFSDVVGFTKAADQMEPEDLAALLNDYLSEMVSIADRFGATIDKFEGDGLMAFFGAPDATDDRDHALRCVQMALVMQDRMADLRRKWFSEGIEQPFQVRIGINTGVANVGDFGSSGRMTYTAIGHQTNLAARIQAECEPGKVLLSHSTWALVKDEVDCAERGEIRVKGIHYPIRVYEAEASGS